MRPCIPCFMHPMPMQVVKEFVRDEALSRPASGGPMQPPRGVGFGGYSGSQQDAGGFGGSAYSTRTPLHPSAATPMHYSSMTPMHPSMGTPSHAPYTPMHQANEDQYTQGPSYQASECLCIVLLYALLCTRWISEDKHSRGEAD